MRLIIPTYDRPKKLERTLAFYRAELQVSNVQIVILDGSESHENELTVSRYANVIHIKKPGSSFLERLISYLNAIDDSELICLGNDEDVFLDRYLSSAELFLTKNPSYSAFLGRYFTLCRPVMGLHRSTHLRSRITQCNIDYDDGDRRLNVLSHVLLAGCSPVFFGVRRAGDFKKSLSLQNMFNIETTQELVDQIYLALKGKIKFSDDLMLLRDETKIGYKYYETRHDAQTYFNESELEHLVSVISDEMHLDTLTSAAVERFCDLRRTRESYDSMSIALILNKNEICKHKDFTDKIQSKTLFYISKALEVVEELIYFQIDKKKIGKDIGRHFLSWCKIVKH